MKLRIGTKLKSIKELNKYPQEEMAEKLNMSTSTYGRYERNETNMDLETLARVSEKLNVPIHEFFPETFQINNTPTNSQCGIVFGNVINNSNSEDTHKELQAIINTLTIEKNNLLDKVNNLQTDKENLLNQINLLTSLIKK